MDTKNIEIITIRISEYLSDKLALQISKALCGQRDVAELRSTLFWFKSETDYFNVIAQSSSGDFVDGYVVYKILMTLHFGIMVICLLLKTTVASILRRK